MGNPNDPSTSAAGSSILFLLVVIGLVMGAFLKFIHFLAKCEKESTRMVPATVSAKRDTETPATHSSKH